MFATKHGRSGASNKAAQKGIPRGRVRGRDVVELEGSEAQRCARCGIGLAQWKLLGGKWMLVCLNFMCPCYRQPGQYLGVV